MLARDSLVQAGLPDNPYARQLRTGFRWLRFEKELENEFREFLSWNADSTLTRTPIPRASGQ
ncbi:hypothetical protein ACSYE6_09125 [Pseudomonas aeruginosa]